MTVQYFWEYVDWRGDYSDGEYATKELAEAAANEQWAEHCEDCGGRNNETLSEEIELVRFYYRDEDAARMPVETVKGCVEYTFYHGDRAEHGYPY